MNASISPRFQAASCARITFSTSDFCSAARTDVTKMTPPRRQIVKQRSRVRIYGVAVRVAVGVAVATIIGAGVGVGVVSAVLMEVRTSVAPETGLTLTVAR